MIVVHDITFDKVILINWLKIRDESIVFFKEIIGYNFYNNQNFI